MITKEKYINEMLKKFREYEKEYKSDISLLTENANVIKMLKDAYLLKDIMTEYQVREKYASFMASSTHLIEYCDKMIDVRTCVNYLKGDKENIENLLSKQYDKIKEHFERVYDNNGKGKFKIKVYDSYNYRFKAKEKVQEFAKLMDIEFDKEELREWKDNTFETKTLKLRIYKNDNLEIIIK